MILNRKWLQETELSVAAAVWPSRVVHVQRVPIVMNVESKRAKVLGDISKDTDLKFVFVRKGQRTCENIKQDGQDYILQALEGQERERERMVYWTRPSALVKLGAFGEGM